MKFTGVLTLVAIVCSASADEHKSGKPGRKVYNSRDRKLGSKSTASPTLSPTLSPTVSPTLSPTVSPTLSPTLSPTVSPTLSPTASKSAKESEDTRTLRRKLHKDRDLVSSAIDPDRIKLRRKINKMRA